MKQEKLQEDTNAALILRRLERVFLVLGVFDLLIFLFCRITGLLSPAPLGSFLIIAGLLLRYRKTRSVGIIGGFSTVFTVGIPVGMVFSLANVPLGLIGTMMRLHPLYSAYGVLVALTVFALSLWTIKALGQDEVVGACQRNNVWIMKSTTMLIIASAIIGGITLLSFFSDVDKFKEQAKERVIQQTAGKYEYYVSAIKVIKSDSDTTVRARVTVWNEDEIKEVPVEWKE